MERMESDVELIQSLVAVFEADRTTLLGDIGAALDAEDTDALERAAHTIKGALGVFAAEPARARAARLELMGHDRVIEQAREEYAELRDDVTVLAEDLQTLLAELEGDPSAR